MTWRIGRPEPSMPSTRRTELTKPRIMIGKVGSSTEPAPPVLYASPAMRISITSIGSIRPASVSCAPGLMRSASVSWKLPAGSRTDLLTRTELFSPR